MHTSSQTMLKCLSKQNLIKIYHAVQDLEAFILTDHDLPTGLMLDKASSTHRCLENVKMFKYAKYDQNIPCGQEL